MSVEVDAQGEQSGFQQGLSRGQRSAAEHLNLRMIGQGVSNLLLVIEGDPDRQRALRQKRREPLLYASNHQVDMGCKRSR